MGGAVVGSRVSRGRSAGGRAAGGQQRGAGPATTAHLARALASARRRLASSPSVAVCGVTASHCVGAVVVGLLVLVCPALLGWIVEPNAGGGWSGAVRIGVAGWLVSHLAVLDLASPVPPAAAETVAAQTLASVVSLPPLLLVVAALALAVRIGRRVATVAGARRSPLVVLATGACYGALGALAAWYLDTPELTADPGAAALRCALLAAAGAGVGVLSVHGPRLLRALPAPVAAQLRRVGPSAAVALLAWFVAGSVVLVAGLVGHLAEVAAVHEAVSPGLVGGALLLLAQVAYLPTLIVWSSAALSGAPVALGSGSLSLAGTSADGLPAVPLLAALPAPGPLPVWLLAGVLAVLGAGALAGWHAHHHRSSRAASVPDRLADAAGIAVVTALGAYLAVWVAGGWLGPWGPLGADPLLVAAIGGVEVFVGAAAASCGLHLLAGRPVLRRAGERHRPR